MLKNLQEIKKKIAIIENSFQNRKYHQYCKIFLFDSSIHLYFCRFLLYTQTFRTKVIVWELSQNLVHNFHLTDFCTSRTGIFSNFFYPCAFVSILLQQCADILIKVFVKEFKIKKSCRCTVKSLVDNRKNNYIEKNYKI